MLYDIVIIGNGPGGHAVLEALASQKFSGRILWVSASYQLPSAFLHSTGLIFGNGVQKGISPLGDYLYDGTLAFKAWYQNQKPLGVDPAVCIHWTGPQNFPLYEERKEQLTRRFSRLAPIKISGEAYVEKGFIIHPAALFLERKKYLKKTLNIEEKEELIVSVSENDHVTLKGHSKRIFKGKILLVTTGAYSLLVPPTGLPKAIGKAVPGHYLVWKNMDWGKFPFVISLGKTKLIYRKNQRELLLGGVSSRQICTPQEKLEMLWSEWNALIGKFPKYSDAEIQTGIRHKGKKRLPFTGQVEGYERVFALGGLYKNGLCLAWAMGEKLVEDILKKL